MDSIDLVGLRRPCSRCGKRRRVSAHWQDTNTVLCEPCALTDGVAFNYSLRNGVVARIRHDPAP